MKLPSPYRLHAAAAALIAALLPWSVPTYTLHADDEPAAPAASQVAAPEAPIAPPTEPVPAAEPAIAPEPVVQTETPVAVEAPSAAQGIIEESTPARTDSRRHRRELVTIMGNSHLPEDESTPEMVTVFGNAQVDGLVSRECVTVLGNTVINGEVRRECVTVLGSVTVNGSVYGELVCIGGRITLGPNAVVDGEVVAVGGSMDVHPTARIHGDKVLVTIPGFGGFGGWLTEWFQDGLAQARVLPHNHAWAWGAAAVIVFLNLLFAVLFREAVTASSRAMETRPVFAFINGALVLLLLPVLFVLLSVSVVGIPLIPIAVAGLFLCWFLGTIGIFFFCGQQFGLADRPVLAVLVGNLIFLLLYALPIVGFAVWSVTGLMGLGAAVTAMGARRRESREARAAALREDAVRRAAGTPTPVVVPQIPVVPIIPEHQVPPTPVPPPPQESASMGFIGSPPALSAAASTGSGTASTSFVPPYSGWTPSQPPPMPPPPPAAPGYSVTMPPLPSDELNERATFWPRLLAFVLDLVAVTVVVNMLGLGSFPMWVLSMMGYHILFWGWRGSTPGGIVLNLQVVRDDRSPMDFKVATVRALSGVFSLVPAGLGFIWVAFDRDSQSWHDKLAGTSVVTLRKSRPLI